MSSSLKQGPVRAELTLEWSGVVNRWASDDLATAGADGHECITLVLAIQVDHGRATLNMWLARPDGSRTPLSHDATPRPCAAVQCDGMLHVDIGDAGQPWLKLTIDERDGLLYVQTAALRDAGFPAGCLDRPTLSALRIDSA